MHKVSANWCRHGVMNDDWCNDCADYLEIDLENHRDNNIWLESVGLPRKAFVLDKVSVNPLVLSFLLKKNAPSNSYETTNGLSR